MKSANRKHELLERSLSYVQLPSKHLLYEYDNDGSDYKANYKF